MSEKTWIEEQKENRLFRGGGHGSDANRMLEHGPINRMLSATQARKISSARYIGELLGIRSLGHLCDLIEQAQMCVDSQTRRDFMKVAIEQWQGKVSAGKKFTIENLV